MNLQHCNALLSEMSNTLDFLEYKYREDDEILTVINHEIQIKVKNFCENANSVLDYIAFELFSKYSKRLIPTDTYDKIERKVSFFYSPRRQKFQCNMDQCFPDLLQKHPLIYSEFEKLQGFNHVQWRKNLHQLVNYNKHRNLSIQKSESTYDVSKINIPGLINIENSRNIKIINSTFNGVHTKDISDLKTKFKNKGTFNYIKRFMFTDLKKPVIPTLREIHYNLNLIVRKFESFELDDLDHSNNDN